MAVAKLNGTLSKMPKIAIVHDWFVGGGAEKVVEAIHELYPTAPIYTSYISPEWAERFKDTKVITGFLQKWPFPKLRKFVPFLRQYWFSHLNLKEYDIVISSTGAEAKGLKKIPGQIHICYCHAPTHYYWSRYDEYLRSPGFGFFNPLARLGLRLLVGPMRRWDYRAAQKPDIMIANSSHIALEIKKYYGRESVVINPPVDTERFTVNSPIPRKGYLIAGRQVAYKRFDLAIAACNELALPLTVIGSGPEHEKLKRSAGPTITMLGQVSNDNLPKYFSSAEAFIFPGLDDFGITPVEAMAAGTPVIAYKAGGALDYVIDGVTGVFFEEQSVSSLSETILKFTKKKYSEDRIRQEAAKFSKDSFKQNIANLLSDTWSASK